MVYWQKKFVFLSLFLLDFFIQASLTFSNHHWFVSPPQLFSLILQPNLKLHYSLLGASLELRKSFYFSLFYLKFQQQPTLFQVSHWKEENFIEHFFAFSLLEFFKRNPSSLFDPKLLIFQVFISAVEIFLLSFSWPKYHH